MDDKRELSAKSGNMFSAFGDANAGGMIAMGFIDSSGPCVEGKRIMHRGR